MKCTTGQHFSWQQGNHSRGEKKKKKKQLWGFSKETKQCSALEWAISHFT